MKIYGFSYLESISGWELIGKHMGPNYPEQSLPTTMTKKDTTVLLGVDDIFYTEDDYMSMYIEYLGKGGDPLHGFNQENLDHILLFHSHI